MRLGFMVVSCVLLMQCKSASPTNDAGAQTKSPSAVAEYLAPPAAAPLVPDPPAMAPKPAAPAPDPYAAAGFIKGTQPKGYQPSPPVESCVRYGDTVVGWIEEADSPGLIIRFWRRADVEGQWCNAPAEDAVLEFDENFSQLMGVANGIAYVDTGTGPDAHNFSVYALPDGNKLWEGRCTGVSFEHGKIHCGRPLRGATAEDCDKFEEYSRDQLSPELVEDVTVDLKTWKETRTGRVVCVAFQ